MLVTGVDVSRAGFILSKQALDTLTKGKAEAWGSVEGSGVKVAKKLCGL